MEKATTNIKNPKARAYFDDVTEGKKPAVQLTAEEYEQGINEFDDGSPRSLVIQLYRPEILWQVTRLAHAEGEWQ